MGSMEERLQILEDKEAIRELQFEYARLTDEQNPDAMAALFTEDAIWDGGEQFGRHEGRSAIHAFLKNTWQTLTWAIHLMTNPEIRIEPSGSEATGRWYLWEPATISGRPLWMVGSYVNRYRKVDGKWRFGHVQLSFEFMTPYESGWVKERYAG